MGERSQAASSAACSFFAPMRSEGSDCAPISGMGAAIIDWTGGGAGVSGAERALAWLAGRGVPRGAAGGRGFFGGPW